MNLDEINGVAAKRTYPDNPEMYGANGFYYYYWPNVNSVFRAQWSGGPNRKFNPFDNTEELTLKEFLEKSKECRLKSKLFPGVKYPDPAQKDEYYYYSDEGEVFKLTEPLNPYYDKVTELRYEEYIDLSIELGVNQEDILW